MEYDEINEIYELTEEGSKKLKRLNAIEQLKEETAYKLWNGSMKVEDFVKEYGVDILLTVAGFMFA